MVSSRMWRSFLARSMTYFLFQGCFKSLGVILEGTVDFTNSSVVLVGWSLLTLKGIAFVIAPVASWLMDIFSNRCLAVFGGLAVGAGFLCQAYLADNIWKLFVVNIISGAGFGLVLLVTTVDLAHTFGDDFGTAFSGSTAIACIGMVGMPLLLDHWLQTYGLSTAVALFGTLLLNMVPFGQMLFDEGNSVEGRILQRHEGNTSSSEPRKINSIQKTVFKAHPVLVFAIVVRLLNSIILFTWILYLVPLGVSKGYNPSTAVYLSSLAGAGFFFGKLAAIFIYYFESMHNVPMLLSGSFVTIAGLTTFVFAQEFYQLCTAAFVTGAIVGFYSSWVNVHIKDVVCHNHFKSAMAWSNVIAGIGIVTSGLVSGLVQNIRGRFEDIYIYLTLVAFLQTLCFLPTVVWINPSVDCK